MIYLLVLLSCAVLVRASRKVREPLIATFLVACALAAFVAIRGPEVSNDFKEYQEWYRLGLNADGRLERPPVLEALFLAVMDASSRAGLPFRWFLWGVALLAISIKIYSIRTVALTGASLWAGVTCYLFSDFLLHEFTQLRAGLAIAFFMASLVLLQKGHTRAYLLATLLGALIHSSALLGLMAWPMSLRQRGKLDTLLLMTLAIVAAARISGLFTLERLAGPLSMLDARLALYVRLASSGISEAAQPLSVRTVLILVFIFTCYAALRRRAALPAAQRPPDATPAGAVLTMLRLVVLGQIALFLLADVKEAAVRIMEFWMTCLPLLAVYLTQTRGMRRPRLIIWLWLAATFGNYVFRAPAMVAPYSIGL